MSYGKATTSSLFLPWRVGELFSLTRDPIQAKIGQCADAGGFVTFEGRVRETHHGREVCELEYEAYGELVITEGEKVLGEATERFGLLSAEAIHRIGRLGIGDTAVWIGVSAAHRKEAFAGCEYIIDELKQRLPIWKKEFYVDGESEWIGCECKAKR